MIKQNINLNLIKAFRVCHQVVGTYQDFYKIHRQEKFLKSFCISVDFLMITAEGTLSRVCVRC